MYAEEFYLHIEANNKNMFTTEVYKNAGTALNDKKFYEELSLITI